jgi:hypothetical protein
VVLLPLAAQMIWFIPGWTCPAFYMLVPCFHSLQYLFIAWSMQLKEKLDREGRQPSSRYVLSESARWGLLNFAGGATLYYYLPLVFSNLGDYSLNMATGIVIAGVQIHHFFVDGVIWKLKRKTVVSPLMVNIADLLGRRPAKAAVAGGVA